MNNYETVAVLRDFFARTGEVGLILPNGWYGRPYDGRARLTRSEANAGSITLELDERLILTFSGEPQVLPTDEGLSLAGFTSLAWDSVGYGSTPVSRHETFNSGTVEFVAWWAGLRQ